MPVQEDTTEATDVEDAVVEELTDSERVCPAQSNLSQCTCNLELELSGKILKFVKISTYAIVCKLSQLNLSLT